MSSGVTVGVSIVGGVSDSSEWVSDRVVGPIADSSELGLALNAFRRRRLRRRLLKNNPATNRPTHPLAHPMDRATNGEATLIPGPIFPGALPPHLLWTPMGLGGRGGAPDPLPHDPRSCRHPGLRDPGGLPLLAECVPRAKAEDAGLFEGRDAPGELSEAKLS